MEVNIVCHFSKVLSKENGEMSLSALGGHVSELNTKQKKYLKKIGFNKFLMDHPNNFILFDDTVILLPAENSPQETKPSPHTLSLPSPIAISNIIKDIQTSNCCTVCLESMEIFAFGPCFHPVCYSCSTKLRVLCDEKLCHICRSHLPEIVFTKQLVPVGELNLTNCIKEQKYGIYFENTETRNKHRKLLEHLCPRCTKKFGDFDDLQNHLKLKHGEYFCSICVQQCKVFTHEREVYSSHELEIHMNEGKGTSKGHPLCRFCEQRYLDGDELLFHLQRHHYSCRLCENGNHVYFPDKDEFWSHAKSEHFVCLNQDCDENMESVFNNAIDLKAHCLKVHELSRKLDQVPSISLYPKSKTSITAVKGRVHSHQKDGSLTCTGTILGYHLMSNFGFIKPDLVVEFSDNIYFNPTSCGLDINDDLREHWKAGDRVMVNALRCNSGFKSKWRALTVTAVTSNNNMDVDFEANRADFDKMEFPSLTSNELPQTSDHTPLSWNNIAERLSKSNLQSPSKLQQNFQPTKKRTISHPTRSHIVSKHTGVGTVCGNLQTHFGFITQDGKNQFEDNIYFNTLSYCHGMNTNVTSLTEQLKPGQKVGFILGETKPGNRAKFRADKVWKYGERPGEETTLDPHIASGAKPKTYNPQKSYITSNDETAELQKFRPNTEKVFNFALKYCAGTNVEEVIFEIETEIEIHGKGKLSNTLFLQFSKQHPIEIFIKSSHDAPTHITLKCVGFNENLVSDLLMMNIATKISDQMLAICGSQHYIILHVGVQKTIEKYSLHFVR